MSRTLVALGRAASIARTARLESLSALVRDSTDRMFHIFERPPLSVQAYGVILNGYLRHRSFLHSLIRNDYEGWSRELYLDSLSGASHVIDGGAHVGLYTVLAGRRLAGRGRVIAFEPDTLSFSALRVNCQRNGCTTVECVNKAVTDRCGVGVFYRSAGTISSSLIDRGDVGPLESTHVEVTSIDQELAEVGEIPSLVIKLDVEGAEPSVLRGMRQTLDRAERATALIEVNPEALRDAGSRPEMLLQLLRELSFDVYVVNEGARTVTAVAGGGHELSKANLLCVKTRSTGGSGRRSATTASQRAAGATSSSG